MVGVFLEGPQEDFSDEVRFEQRYEGIEGTPTWIPGEHFLRRGTASPKALRCKPKYSRCFV